MSSRDRSSNWQPRWAPCHLSASASLWTFALGAPHPSPKSRTRESSFNTPGPNKRGGSWAGILFIPTIRYLTQTLIRLLIPSVSALCTRLPLSDVGGEKLGLGCAAGRTHGTPRVAPGSPDAAPGHPGPTHQKVRVAPHEGLRASRVSPVLSRLPRGSSHQML